GFSLPEATAPSPRPPGAAPPPAPARRFESPKRPRPSPRFVQPLPFGRGPRVSSTQSGPPRPRNRTRTRLEELEERSHDDSDETAVQRGPHPPHVRSRRQGDGAHCSDDNDSPASSSGQSSLGRLH